MKRAAVPTPRGEVVAFAVRVALRVSCVQNVAAFMHGHNQRPVGILSWLHATEDCGGCDKLISGRCTTAGTYTDTHAPTADRPVLPIERACTRPLAMRPRAGRAALAVSLCTRRPDACVHLRFGGLTKQ
jgi:hypothetical protein